MVCESDQADGLSFDAWFGKLAGLPDRLIYEHPLDGVSDGEVQKALAEPEAVLAARLWTSAMEHAAAEGLPVLCPVSQDATLAIDWEPADGETATSESIEDVFFFVDRARLGMDSRPHSDVTASGAPAVVQSGISLLRAILGEQRSAHAAEGFATAVPYACAASARHPERCAPSSALTLTPIRGRVA